MNDYLRNLLSVDTHVQRTCRIAALVAFLIWCVLFFAIVSVSWFFDKTSTSRWLGLFSPLMFVFAADQIVNRAWYSRTWSTPVQRTPEFWVAMGSLWAALGILAGALSVLDWFSSGWVR